MSDQKSTSDQWELEGRCDICRRQKYCNTECRLRKIYVKSIIQGAVIKAFADKLAK